MNRDRIEAERLEHGTRVRFGGARDIAQLGIENHRNIVRDRCPRLGESLDPGSAIHQIVGEVRLVGTDEIRGRFDDGAIESDDAAGIPGERRREAG